VSRCPAVAFLLLAVHGSCAALGLGIQCSSSLDGGLGARLTASGKDFRFILLSGDSILDRMPVPGFTSLWFRLGPLAPRGLLREMENPLGFSAGSPVFKEETELVLDGSLPASGDFSLLLQPFPGALGFFARMDADGERAGAFAGLRTPGCAAEAALSVSRAPADAPVKDWYFPEPPYPGGPMMNAAARLRWEAARLSLSLSTALSACRRGDSGAFVHAAAAARWGALDADLFLGAASPGWRGPDGDACGRSFIAGARAGILGVDGTLELRSSISTGRQQPALHPFIPTQEKLGCTAECALGGSFRGRLSGDVSVEFDEDGQREERCQYVMAVLWKLCRESYVEARINGEGIRLGCCLAFGKASLAAELTGTVDFLENGVETASFLELYIRLRGGALRLGAGYESFDVQEGFVSIPRHLRFELGWDSRALWQ
jgi:hypothetical protein